jgi:D-glycero-alpha-D-manno-heptose 1-phosphate guanylyltransferase
MEKLDAIILAGGLGTRLREVLTDLPKVLAPVNNRPFLDILLNFLNKSHCIRKVIIAVGYMADKITKEYSNRPEYIFKILFSEEKELLGTGGAIKKALQYVETDNVLALNGDSYVDVNVNDLMRNHRKRNAAMTIVLKKVENANRYGSVKLNTEGRIISFEEKIPGKTRGYINAGMYVFKKELFDDVKEDKVLSLEKELLPIFLGNGVYGYISHGKFIDIGIPETFKVVSRYLKEGW